MRSLFEFTGCLGLSIDLSNAANYVPHDLICNQRHGWDFIAGHVHLGVGIECSPSLGLWPVNPNSHQVVVCPIPNKTTRSPANQVNDEYLFLKGQYGNHSYWR